MYRERIIVSLTSIPSRIDRIWRVIESIISQDTKPDKILLFLSEEEFDNKEAVCSSLSRYQKSNFEIRWVGDNLRAYKKFYYAFQEFPNDIVITVDDDIVYSSSMINELMDLHYKFPNAVIGRRGLIIPIDMYGNIKPFKHWPAMYKEYGDFPRNNSFVTTGGGTLYIPNLFGDEVFKTEQIKRLCPYSDDIWMKIMELLYDIPAVVASKKFEDITIEEVQKDGLFYTINQNGGDDFQLNTLLNYYGKEELLNKISLHNKKDLELLFDKYNCEEKQQIEEVLDLCSREKRILIYGAGDFANRLYRCIKDYKIDCSVIGFITSGDTKSDLCGIKVYDCSEVKETKFMILVATRISVQSEIRDTIKGKGIDMNRVYFLNEQQLNYLRKLENGM